MQTLVLNRAFFPVLITPWRRAVALVYEDAARVVDEDFRAYSFEAWRQGYRIEGTRRRFHPHALSESIR